MLEILKTLKDTPLPSILVIGGILFLLLSFVRKVGSSVELEPEKKGLVGFIGFILLCAGIGLYIIPAAQTPMTSVPTQTAMVEPPAQVIQPTANILPPTSIPVIQPTAISPTQATSAGYIPSCNWASDWQLQSDGSYLWVGSPPGTPSCQNIGQAGEVLQRMRNGENLTLIVEVGDGYIGLDICRGNFTATKVIDGQKCVPKNPELWIKVSGKLVVTGSDGFLVGTGK